ncbi:MAG: hypothetical protein WD801_11735 [Gemmatimonadaceae bacterium]
MHRPIIVATLLVGAVATSVAAQQPDSLRARADSIALVRELEARGDTLPVRTGPQAPQVIQRLLPDLSVVGDIIGDLSPEGSTQEDASRFGVREVELALQAAVDPYFRGDVFLGFSDAEGVHIEQAFLTTTALRGLEARLGRFLMPVTKVNATHRHDLHTIEFPLVAQRFLGEEGLKGTGVYLSRILAPLGFYQELQLAAVDRFGEAGHGHEDEAGERHTIEPPNKDLSGLGFSARLRNYWDFSEDANLELSGSAVTGRREQPYDFGILVEENAINARQSLLGADLTFRWRPLQQGLYRSFIVQAEFLRQVNERVTDPNYGGPDRDFSGAYLFARWQLTRRVYLGGRYDWLQDPDAHDETDTPQPGRIMTAASGYLQWFPSEFSKLMLGLERTMPTGLAATNRILLQATFALGPHKPHPF